MFDAVFLAADVEHVAEVAGCWSVAAAGLIAELHAVVSEHRMDLVGRDLDQGFQEGGGGDPVGLLLKPGEGDLEVRSIATNMCSLPSSARTSARSI